MTQPKTLPFNSPPLVKPKTIAFNNAGKATGTPSNVNLPASHQGAVDFINTGKPTFPTQVPPEVHQSFLDKLGTGLIDNFAGAGAEDIKSSMTEKNPLVAGAKFASGLGKSAFSAATFIPVGIFNLGKDIVTGKFAKNIDQAQYDPILGQNTNSTFDKIAGAANAFNTGLSATAPLLAAAELANSLPNNTNNIKGGKVLNNKIEPYKAKQAIKAESQVDNLVGTITQGKISDLPKAKSALGSIDIGGIKTYKDLSTGLNDKIQIVAKKLDEVLLTNPNAIPLDELNMTAKVGNETITHNFVNDALNQLKELYTKTNDPASLADVNQLESKAQTNGLTIKEVNDLARQYGNEFGSKAFSKTGDPLTSVNAQGFENTRSGLKTTARQQFNDPIYQAADEQMTNLIKTRDLAENMSEKVNQLKQKIQTKSFGARAGAMAAKVIDHLSGGALKGIVNYFIPRGEGLKVLNALDLEKSLSKNLKVIDQVVNKNLPEADIISKLQTILDNPPKITEKGGVTKQTIEPQKLKTFKPEANKTVKVNNYQNPDYPSYKTSDLRRAERLKFQNKQSSGKQIDINKPSSGIQYEKIRKSKTIKPTVKSRK